VAAENDTATVDVLIVPHMGTWITARRPVFDSPLQRFRREIGGETRLRLSYLLHAKNATQLHSKIGVVLLTLFQSTI